MVVCRTFRVSISSLSPKGFGVFTYSEPKKKTCEAEVFDALPGEKVLVEKCVAKRGKSFRVLDLIKSSQGRQESPCGYFGSCGGCQTLHMTDQLQKGFKRQKILESLKNGNLECRKVRNVEIYGRQNRRRFRFEFIKTQNSIRLGLKQYNSHSVVDLNHCYVADQSISKVLTPLKIFLAESVHKNFKATVTVLLADNGLDILASSSSDGCFYLSESLAKDFMQKNNIARFAFDDQEYVLESPHVTLGEVKVNVPHQAFLQASRESERVMQDVVESFCNKHSQIKKIIDLYCGLGTFLIPLSNQFVVHGFEVNGQAVQSLKSALGIKSNNNTQVFARDLVSSPLKVDELNEYQCAILNPPRVGVSRGQLIEISKSKIKVIVYVSCNPDTFARDCRTLSDNGYFMSEIVPIDQFYGSYHIELIALLERN